MRPHRAPLSNSDFSRLLPVTWALGFSTIVCLAFLIARAFWAREIRWTGFFGNLVLAWIPYILAMGTTAVLDHPRRRPLLLGACVTLWLLFFPNAAYIVTDLIHLRRSKGSAVPPWFDYLLITSYAWTGLFLCHLSLSMLQMRIAAKWSRLRGWCFAAGALAAGALGVYVGRFFRWNSWDVITRPEKIGKDLIRFTAPETFKEGVAFCGAFFALSLAVYLVMHAVAHHLVPDSGQTETARNN